MAYVASTLGTYSTGTVTVVNGSTAVTGSGTVWGDIVNEGDLFTIDDDKFYYVAALNSDTSLTLDKPYAESSASGINYRVMLNTAAHFPSDVAAKVERALSGMGDVYCPINHASSGSDYGLASASLYGHAKASGTTPKAPGTASIGTETNKFARGDHVHPHDDTKLDVTEAALTYLPLNNDSTINGKLEISGQHNSLANRGLKISGNNQYYAMIIQDTGITKSTGLPQNYRNMGIFFTDSLDERIGALYSYITNAGLSRLALRSQGITANSNSVTCTITCNVDANGNVYTEAPTPPIDDNSTQIATTAFVHATLLKSVTNLYFESVSAPNNSNTNIGSFTAPKAGVYLLQIIGNFDGNSNGNRRLMLSSTNTGSNANRFDIVQCDAVTNSDFSLPFIALRSMTANETVYINVRQTSGSSLNVSGGLRYLYLGELS